MSRHGFGQALNLNTPAMAAAAKVGEVREEEAVKVAVKVAVMAAAGGKSELECVQRGLEGNHDVIYIIHWDLLQCYKA